MGVLSCSRRGCDNIMCDTCVQGIGYICWDCQDEFKLYVSSHCMHIETDEEITRVLSEFMETNEGSYDNQSSDAIDDFFKANTR